MPAALVPRGFLITETLTPLAAEMFTHVTGEHLRFWSGAGNIWMLRLVMEWAIFYIQVSCSWSVG